MNQFAVSPGPTRAFARRTEVQRAALSDRLDRRPWPFIALCLCHIPIALAVHWAPVLGTVHAVLTLLIGLGLAIGGKGAERAAGALAYIMGAEVFWRMTKSPLPWEYAKYASVLIMGCCIVRFRAFRHSLIILLYFLLLLPSAIITLQSAGFGDAREFISFNLSGPLTLMMAVAVFSRLRINTQGALKILAMCVAPSTAILTLIVYRLVTHSRVHFTGESNFTTSAGFGPNQVASALALSAILTLLCAIIGRLRITSRIWLCVAAVAMLAFSALTFSRGGIYLASGSLGLGMLYLLRDKRVRSKAVFIGAGIVLVAGFWVVPKLNSFTGSQFSRRFNDTTPTKRDELAKEDFRTFLEHPMLGVGPGLGSLYRERGIVAHTEYTRLIAEHGMFGLVALGCLLIAGFHARKRLQSHSQLALVTTLQVWVMLYMMIDGMRTFGPSFLYGFAFLSLVEPKSPELSPMAVEPDKAASPRVNSLRASGRLEAE
jgi:hypothetical protein